MMSREEMKRLVAARLGERASPLFLERIANVLDRAENEQLPDACVRVGKLVGLFIDEKLGAELGRELGKELP